MLLAIDTSAGTSAAVVDRRGGVLAERSSSDTRLHAEVVGTLVAGVLAEAGVAVTALSGVAVGMGPGPFTGLRVGIAAAQAFALGAGIPVVRVVSHDAIAFARYAGGGSGRLLVVTDARRREVYWSAYAGASDAGIPVRAHGPALTRPADLDGTVTGSGFPLDGDTERIDAEEVSAGALGMLAETMFSAGVPFAAAEPLYLRSPDVTLSAGPKRVS
jgi:tRNA threonylcarbamoyl adenosine modification protein YeaZ